MSKLMGSPFVIFVVLHFFVSESHIKPQDLGRAIKIGVPLVIIP